jgi:hypothetical protein
VDEADPGRDAGLAGMRFGSSAGRPRTGAAATWVDTWAGCLLVGLAGGALGAAVAGVLALVGVI